MKYGNNPKNYLVIEFADGIFQRETALLLKMPQVRHRIHKLIFCASDSIGVFGGIKILKNNLALHLMQFRDYAQVLLYQCKKSVFFPICLYCKAWKKIFKKYGLSLNKITGIYLNSERRIEKIVSVSAILCLLWTLIWTPSSSKNLKVFSKNAIITNTEVISLPR